MSWLKNGRFGMFFVLLHTQKLLMDKLSVLAFAALLGLSVSGQNVPIDFEPTGHGASWNWKVFENGYNPPLVVVQNPDTNGINPSPNVARFEALQQGQPFVGCESKHGTDIGTFTIDQNNAIIRIMVYKTAISDVGIKLVRWDNWSLGEIKVANTKTHEWEQLEFDFSAHIGLTYDQIVIFPDFTPRPADRTIYIDNVWGGLYVPPPPPPPPIDSASMTLPNFFSPNFDGINDEYRPNMQHADWAEWRIMNRWGQELFYSESTTDTWNGMYNGTTVSPGVYFVQAKCGSNQVGNTVEKRGVIHIVD
jgi:gliding motility-associated-like protein